MSIDYKIRSHKKTKLSMTELLFASYSQYQKISSTIASCTANILPYFNRGIGAGSLDAGLYILRSYLEKKKQGKNHG